MTTVVDGNTITLMGAVGDMRSWYDDDEGGFDASSVMSALTQVGRGKDITVVINSGGGICTEGSAIHAILTAHTGKKTVVVQGIAASAASLIAMSGDEILMSPGAIMMIHDPSGITIGTVADHEAQIVSLNAYAEAAASIYAEKSGQTPAQARQDMKNELWMTPEAAVKKGYATGVVSKADKADEPQPAAYNYSMYKHPPAHVMSLTTSHAWDKPKRAAAQPAPVPPKKDPVIMALSTEQQAAVDAEVARLTPGIKAKAEADATAALGGTSISAGDAAKIVAMCNDAGVPGYAAGLIMSKSSVADATTKIEGAKQIVNVVAMARKRQPTIPADFAAVMISEGKTLQQVESALLQHMVQESERSPINSTFLPSQSSDPASDAAQVQLSKDNMNRTLASMGLGPAK